MFFKKTSTFTLLAALINLGFTIDAYAGSVVNIKAKNAITLEISAPDPMANLAPNAKPDPIYLQLTTNDGATPLYSAAIFPGDTKPVILKVTSASSHGSQLQFVTNTSGSIQPMSFIYVLSGNRLACLINKNAKLQIEYSINTKLLDVRGIPADC